VYDSLGTALSVAALPNKIDLPSTPVKGSQIVELSEKKRKLSIKPNAPVQGRYGHFKNLLLTA
jgi:hypothetical protein